MLQARERGTLMRGEADFQLHLVYLWYERQPRRAIRLLDELRGRYPHNPVFPQRIAEIESDYLQDHEASLSTWRALADAAQAGRVAAAPLVLTSARLGLAKQLNALSQPSRAVDVLKTIVAARPTQPYSALALAYFQLGGAYDRLGQRDAARTAYQSAFDAAPRDDPSRIRTRARRAITELQRR
jgi:tetratricopeptide (TPR) repeat protein